MSPSDDGRVRLATRPSSYQLVRWSTTALPSYVNTHSSRSKRFSPLPLGFVVTPMMPLPPADAPLNDVKAVGITPLARTKSVARCRTCYAYISSLCGVTRGGFTCAMCDGFTTWSEATDGRRAARRYTDVSDISELHRLEEIKAESTYEYEIASECGSVSRRAFVAIVDVSLSSGESSSRLVKRAIEAWRETEPEGKVAVFTYRGDVLEAIADDKASSDESDYVIRAIHSGNQQRFIRRLVDVCEGSMESIFHDAQKNFDFLEIGRNLLAGTDIVSPSDAKNLPLGIVIEQVLELIEDAIESNTISSARVLSLVRSYSNASSRQLPCMPGSGVRPTAADFELASSEADALSAPASTYYESLGKRCLSVGVTMDLVVKSNEFNDLSTLAPLAEYSGGWVALYRDDDEKHVSKMESDIWRMVKNAAVSYDATLRVRTSGHLEITEAYGDLHADASYAGLYHVPSCEHSTGFAFQFDVVDDGGVSNKSRRGSFSQPCVQIAYEYSTNVGARRVRKRRIHTTFAGIAKSGGLVYKNADPEVIVTLLAHQVMSIAQEEGLTEARRALYNWFVVWTKSVGSGTKSFATIGKLVYGLLSSPIIHPIGIHPDVRVTLRSRVRRLGAHELALFCYPCLREFAQQSSGEYEEVEDDVVPLSRAAIVRETSIYILQGNVDRVIIYYGRQASGAYPCPPPPGSSLERTVNKICRGGDESETTTFTPQAVYVRGGIDDPEPWDIRLVEDLETEYSNSLGFQGFITLASMAASDLER